MGEASLLEILGKGGGDSSFTTNPDRLGLEAKIMNSG